MLISVLSDLKISMQNNLNFYIMNLKNIILVGLHIENHCI